MELKEMTSLRLGGVELTRLCHGGVELWRKPAAYQRVEYITFDGNSWIDTGFIPDEHSSQVATGDVQAGAVNYSMTLCLQNTTVGKRIYLFGSSNGTEHNGTMTYTLYSPSTYNMLNALAGTAGGSKYVPGLVDGMCTLGVHVKETYVGGKTDLSGYNTEFGANVSGSILTGAPIYVGACSGVTDGEGFIGQVSEFIVAAYTSTITLPLAEDTWLLHLVPVYRVADGEVGMYDTVSRAFFANAGTGVLRAGAAVVGEVYDS